MTYRLINEKWRIDFFKYSDTTGKCNEHIMREFDDIQDAVNAASEGRKDGYVTWLLRHVFDGKYEPVVKLV